MLRELKKFVKKVKKMRNKHNGNINKETVKLKRNEKKSGAENYNN